MPAHKTRGAIWKQNSLALVCFSEKTLDLTVGPPPSTRGGRRELQKLPQTQKNLTLCFFMHVCKSWFDISSTTACIFAWMASHKDGGVIPWTCGPKSGSLSLFDPARGPVKLFIVHKLVESPSNRSQKVIQIPLQRLSLASQKSLNSFCVSLNTCLKSLTSSL